MKPPNPPRGWNADLHCPPERGERVLHPHVWVLMSTTQQDFPFERVITGIEMCQCGRSRDYQRVLDYSLGLSLMAAGTAVQYVSLKED